MNFQEAIQEMKKGKNVKRRFDDEYYFFLRPASMRYVGVFFTKKCDDPSDKKDESCNRAELSLFDIEATDWEIYDKPKETLSDKIYSPSEGVYNDKSVEIDDVKKSIAILIREIKMWDELYPNYSIEKILEKIKEIFGEKLI